MLLPSESARQKSIPAATPLSRDASGHATTKPQRDSLGVVSQRKVCLANRFWGVRLLCDHGVGRCSAFDRNDA